MMSQLDEGYALLARCRQQPIAWVEAACVEKAGDDPHWQDPNATRRYALLLALQYDLQPGDIALVCYLLEQEALHHRRAPLAGLDPALSLASYLLATFRAVEHVWLFAEAKLSNFDTVIGFESLHLVSAGIEETLAFVHAASAHPLQQTVLEWLVGEDGRCIFGEDDLALWWQRAVAQFPARLNDEAPMVRLDQALQLGDLAEARRWLEVWEETLARTPKHLSTLAYYWQQMQDWDRAGEIAAEFLACDGITVWNQALMQVNATSYHRQAGRAAEAWGQLKTARETLEGIEEWWRIGLGRSVLEEALLITQALPPGDEAAQEA